MDVRSQIARIRSEGEALARAAEAGPMDAAVPGCPGWDVDDLLRHIGDVHRWAAAIVRERVQSRLRRDHEGPSGRDALLAWYREGCRGLVEALEGTTPEETFWFWGPGPNALAFWARRQANETAVHRCDAESARGPITPLGTADAMDGLDEWLGLAALRASAPRGEGRVLRLVASDGGASWRVSLGEHVEVLGDGAGDCELQGTASDLFLWSMNRRGLEGITVSGDADLVRVWAANVRF
ncbi:MAG TPA: maleylpyruvate isomerase family mycothiol-dependent enzyme [Candidatus Acidoferrales bacterium]|nr:maleylpyruvate isomerase family mycothiol-dependent enzyme [Candidatus Acidoferrales bacterium]